MAGNYLSALRGGSPWDGRFEAGPSPASFAAFPWKRLGRAPRRPTSTPPASSSTCLGSPTPAGSFSDRLAMRFFSHVGGAARPPCRHKSRPALTMSQSVAYIVIHETEYPLRGAGVAGPAPAAPHPRALPQSCAHRPASPSPRRGPPHPRRGRLRQPGDLAVPRHPHDGLLVRAESRVTVVRRALPAPPTRRPGSACARLPVPPGPAAPNASTPSATAPRPRARGTPPSPTSPAGLSPGCRCWWAPKALMDLIFKTFTFDAEATGGGTPVQVRCSAQARRVPGLRPPDDRCAALHRPAGALHVGLPAHRPAARQAAPRRRRRLHAWVAVWCPATAGSNTTPPTASSPTCATSPSAGARLPGRLAAARVILGGLAQAPRCASR